MADGNDEHGAEILKQAQALFSELGVEAVSMHQVAKAAGVGQATLYRRYPNKGNLCMALMKAKFDQLMAEMKQDLEESSDLPVRERLSRFMTRQILFAHRDIEWMKEVFRSCKLKDVRENVFEAPPFKFLYSNILQLLEEASGRGELIALDPPFAASLITASITPELLFYWDEKGYTAEEIAKQYTQTFIAPLFVS
ncbi:AcrR family transcriptional regulator [Paenibacillus phyllosphaerae]|uniref:AcrR family transcriptional regulator n=1 Tax=Paenibacillus phyllosphaerae TaxID=274593 RepID=A0A7W5B297_9BACL|nr:TetR/AcrR family transcriptional regulator [Paenibacillus phyllosphaerae]MBB3112341.1 AcrR family transcriptional regulator [Paenibacillus phyllosphaerae]